jgi:hypothetical protein
VKTKLFLIPLLLIIFLSACVKKQVETVELPAEEVIAEIVAEPLPPINERLNGTVWVSSLEMWEDIPIDSAVCTYTFTDKAIIGKSWMLDTSTGKAIIRTSGFNVDYKNIDNNTIEYFTDVDNIWRETIWFANDGEHLIERHYYPDDYWMILDGRAKIGDFDESILYPYTAELRDMDYTKDLQLEGTEWIEYARKKNESIEIYKESGLPETSLYFYKGICINSYEAIDGFKKKELHYFITSKFIVIEDYGAKGFGDTTGYATVLNGKMIITSSYYPQGFMLQH